jgi:hypothetical protein
VGTEPQSATEQPPGEIIGKLMRSVGSARIAASPCGCVTLVLAEECSVCDGFLECYETFVVISSCIKGPGPSDCTSHWHFVRFRQALRMVCNKSTVTDFSDLVRRPVIGLCAGSHAFWAVLVACVYFIQFHVPSGLTVRSLHTA